MSRENYFLADQVGIGAPLGNHCTRFICLFSYLAIPILRKNLTGKNQSPHYELIGNLDYTWLIKSKVFHIIYNFFLLLELFVFKLKLTDSLDPDRGGVVGLDIANIICSKEDFPN